MILSKYRSWFRRRLALGEAGIAGVELALATPMLAILMTGGFDFGRAIYEQHRLAAAAEAGVQYATALTANEANSSGIIQAARNDANDTANSLTVTTNQCTCPGGTPQCSTATTCTGSTVTGTYVKVAVSESISTVMTYPFVPSPFTLSGVAMMRVQ
jgi:Flp pilus assembly protein TadG